MILSVLILESHTAETMSTSGKKSSWDNYCDSDVSLLMYAGKPTNEVVFWAGDEQIVDEVELNGYRKVLKRGGGGNNKTIEWLSVW